MRNNILIDNWMLQNIAHVFYHDMTSFEYFTYQGNYGDPNYPPDGTKERIANGNPDFLIPLSHLVNAIVFYDKVLYNNNYNSRSWKEYNRFSRLVTPILSSANTPILELKKYDLSENISKIIDSGLENYLILSKLNDCDLILGPKRAEKLLTSNLRTVNQDKISEFLKIIDSTMFSNVEKIEIKELKNGIVANTKIPSLLHFVLKESKDKEDIFQSALRLRNSPELISFKRKLKILDEEIGNSNNLINLVSEVDEISKELLKGIGIENHPSQVTIGFNLFFFVLEYTGSVKFKLFNKKRKENFQSNEYLILFRDLANCRLEYYGARYQINRLFESFDVPWEWSRE